MRNWRFKDNSIIHHPPFQVNNSEAIGLKSRFSSYLVGFFCNIEIDEPQISLSRSNNILDMTISDKPCRSHWGTKSAVFVEHLFQKEG
jgi:hypothetical protein